MSASFTIDGLGYEAQCKAARHFFAVAQTAVDAIADNKHRADALEGLAVAAFHFDSQISIVAMNAAKNLRHAEEQQQTLWLLLSKKVND